MTFTALVAFDYEFKCRSGVPAELNDERNVLSDRWLSHMFLG